MILPREKRKVFEGRFVETETIRKWQKDDALTENSASI